MNAAHCVRGAAVNQFRVVAGEYDLNVVSGNEQNRNVVAYTMHENYGPVTSYNDISLIFVTMTYLDSFFSNTFKIDH